MGGDLLVRGAVALARRARVSPMVVAFSVVAFGTSVPELVVTLQASLTGYPGLVLGNVVGSNTANALLVAGAAGAVFPLVTTGETVRRDAVIMMVTSLGFALMCILGGLTRWSGAFLLSGFAVVLGVTLRSTLQSYRESDGTPLDWVLGIPSRPGMIILFLAAGLVGLPVGASLMVSAAVEIAGRMGVSETVIGLSIVAAGTSLPELATSVVAAVQRRTEVILGTIIGSNTFNILAIMGVGAAVSPAPIAISRRFMTLDLSVMLAASAVLTLFALLRRPLGRRAGMLLIAGYVGYLALLFISV
jgi:cation:H+ antiporter